MKAITDEAVLNFRLSVALAFIAGMLLAFIVREGVNMIVSCAR
jgi:hypothetical protein